MSIIDFILGWWAGPIHRSLKWKQTKHSLWDFLLHQFLGFWCEKIIHSLYYNTCIWLIQFKHSKRKTENSSFQLKSFIYQGWKIPFSKIVFFNIKSPKSWRLLETTFLLSFFLSFFFLPFAYLVNFSLFSTKVLGIKFCHLVQRS